MKRVSIVLGLMMIICSIAMAGGNQETKESGEKKFAVSFMTLNNPFWVAELDTLKSEIEKNGDSLAVFDGQLDLSKQISQIENAVNGGADVIFVSPYDWKGIRPALEYAKEKNVPVVNIDTLVFDKDLVAVSVVSDNVLGGRLCAEYLAKELNGKGNIAVIDLSTNMAVQDRTKGFFEVMENYPEIKVVARQDGNGSLEAALPIMENMLQAHPDIDGVFGTNDPAALGAIAAIEAANKIDEIAVVGLDGAENACQKIIEGKMLGTAAQYPHEVARVCVEQAYKILAGEEPEEDIIYIKEDWISIDNVHEYMKENAY